MSPIMTASKTLENRNFPDAMLLRAELDRTAAASPRAIPSRCCLVANYACFAGTARCLRQLDPNDTGVEPTNTGISLPEHALREARTETKVFIDNVGVGLCVYDESRTDVLIPGGFERFAPFFRPCKQ